jgi:hypothetical protein
VDGFIIGRGFRRRGKKGRAQRVQAEVKFVYRGRRTNMGLAKQVQA